MRQNLRNRWIEDLQTGLSVLCGVVVAFPVSKTTPYELGSGFVPPKKNSLGGPILAHCTT